MNKIFASLKLLKIRLESKMPKFWRQMSKAGIFIGGLGLALVAVKENIPDPVFEVAKYLVAIGTTITFVSQFTTEDPVISKITPTDLTKKNTDAK